ncbi:InlB B-repeat-containing protein [Mycoplasmatota bacterium]|nr:InlB B-repeat-containing protein [Mycoplasmatota bacterium]
MKKGFSVFIFIFLFGFFLMGCNAFSPITDSLTVTTTDIPTTEVSDLESELRSIYELAVEANTVDMTYDEWVESVRGPKGEDGKSILLRVDELNLQWQYLGDDTWNDLLNLSDLTSSFVINSDGYWVINGEVTPFLAGIHEDDTMVTVTFNLNEGLLPDGYSTSMEVVKGQRMQLPIPSKDGFIFSGWYEGESINDGQFYNQYPITEGVVLYARWRLDPGYGDQQKSNHLYFRIVEEDDTSITLELVLGGNVEMCGFDFKINFTDTILSLQSMNNELSSTIVNHSVSGTIHFNYVSSTQNINVETIISTIIFNKTGVETVNVEFDIIQFIRLDDNGIDIYNTSSDSSDFEYTIE